LLRIREKVDILSAFLSFLVKILTARLAKVHDEDLTPTITKEGEADDTNRILLPNDQKEERSKKERKLKWAFDEPRQEFIDSLQEQATFCVSTVMHVKMFAADFGLQQKALDDLTSCIETNKKDTIDNLDIILKWITLRLFDTNHTSLQRTLSYLEALFDMLSTQEFHLSDYEANVFVPLLIDRSGANSCESIKLALRGLFKQLCNVYPPSKTFCFVLDSLKSENWRTRVECIDKLISLINHHAVCTPAEALPVLAQLLADRDPSVRTAALSTFLQAYTFAGEELWRYLAAIPGFYQCDNDWTGPLCDDEKSERLPPTVQQNSLGLEGF